MGWRELLDSVGEGARTARSYISPWQYLSATDVASMAPGGGLVNAWQDSGRGWQNLKAGNWGQAAIDYGNMGLNLASEMPALGMAVMAGKKGVKGIRAFHGSPHDFDRFDMSKIGTGEGAQAYGHGLYFAEDEGVARSYRDVLAGANNRFMDSGKGSGVVIENPIGDGWRAAMYQGEPGFKDQTGLATRGLDDQFFPTFDEALAHARKQGYIKHDSPALTHWDDGYHKPIDSAGIGNLEDLTGAQIVARDPGRMYEVRINADPEHFLDWDKTVSEQSEIARNALKKALGYDISPEDGGQRLANRALRNWEALQSQTVADLISNETMLGGRGLDAHSEALAKAGIPGIKYLDAGSRGVGDGTRNYVVFDDRLVEILKKYGWMPGMAIPAAAMLEYESAGQPPQM